VSPQRSCLLCEWREPIAGRRYEHLPRCRDVEACWGRVTSVLGEDWPVNDGRLAKTPPPVPEPMSAVEPPPADAPMEDPAWLVS
jgi:hypothetical protein